MFSVLLLLSVLFPRPGLEAGRAGRTILLRTLWDSVWLLEYKRSVEQGFDFSHASFLVARGAST
jgi:hypothetical protein